MSATTSMLHVRVDDTLKTQATEALGAMGLTVSDAVRLLLHRVVAEQALPLELKVPNADTVAAMQEARALRRACFASADALLADLDQDD